jgi:hypothetical protein
MNMMLDIECIDKKKSTKTKKVHLHRVWSTDWHYTKYTGLYNKPQLKHGLACNETQGVIITFKSKYAFYIHHIKQ